jgi:hypothetical protein
VETLFGATFGLHLGHFLLTFQRKGALNQLSKLKGSSRHAHQAGPPKRRGFLTELREKHKRLYGGALSPKPT